MFYVNIMTPSISGPISLSYYKYKNKNYLFLGDTHNKNTLCNPCNDDSCIYITELISKIADNAHETKIRVDIYIESFYKTKQIINNTRNIADIKQSPLTDITNYFSNCLSLDKTNCKYNPYVQFHYSDIRNIEYGSQYTQDTIFYILKTMTSDVIVMNNNSTFETQLFIKKILITYINFMMLICNNNNNIINIYLTNNGKHIYDEYIKTLKSHIFEEKRFNRYIKNIDSHIMLFDEHMHKIYKQIQNMDFIEEFIRQKLIQLFIGLHRNVFFLHNMLQTEINNEILFYKNKEIIQNALSSINITLFMIESHIMDAYLLGRLLKQKKDDSILKIIYVGGLHKELYDEFFNSILNLKPIQNIGKNFGPNVMQCINYDYEELFRNIYAYKYSKYFKKYNNLNMLHELDH